MLILVGIFLKNYPFDIDSSDIGININKIINIYSKEFDRQWERNYSYGDCFKV